MANLKSLVVCAAMAMTVAGQAEATAGCTGTATKLTINGGSGSTTTSTFFKQGFNPQCSNNVYLDYLENSATNLSVGSVSVKGNQRFGGNSNGGAIKAMQKCSADPCTATDSSAAATAASSL